MDYAQRIFVQARAGTPNNPGFSDALASLLVAQARHETGDFKSNFFRNNNNAFGYAYYSGSLYQTGAGGIADNGQPIAHYATIEDSTKEIIDWIWRRYRAGQFPEPSTIETPEQYAKALKAAKYYGDTLENYLRGLRAFFKPIAAIQGAGLILAIVALAYLYKRGTLRL